MAEEDDPRSAYWNESYARYWKSRVEEAGEAGVSAVQSGDARTEGNWVYKKLLQDHPFVGRTVLDVGCAWGRLFPLYAAHGMTISGIDISSAMIAEAEETYGDNEDVETLQVAVAEKLPFAAESFDNVVCVAVFDATHQHLALAEFLRVLKPGGRLYLTGKNDNYLAEDELALDAEHGARFKGHPNSFTDLGFMLSQCEAGGCSVLARYLFERRGDFADFRHHGNLEQPFYEWLLVIEKLGDVPALVPFSSDYSKTFKAVRRDGKD
jgi:SAM-dependent methyltransferase